MASLLCGKNRYNSLSEGARTHVWDDSLRHEHIVQYPELQSVEDPEVGVHGRVAAAAFVFCHLLDSMTPERTAMIAPTVGILHLHR